VSCLLTKDMRKNGRKMREATQDMVERQSTLLVEIGGILVDSREVRK